MPIGMPDYALSLLWHNARAEDPAHRWLRATLRQLIERKLA